MTKTTRLLSLFAIGLTVVLYQNCSPNSDSGPGSTNQLALTSGSGDPNPVSSPLASATATPSPTPYQISRYRCSYYADGSTYPHGTFAIDTPLKNVLFGTYWGPLIKCEDGNWFLGQATVGIDAYDVCEFYSHASFAWVTSGGTLCAAKFDPNPADSRAALAVKPSQGYISTAFVIALSSYNSPNVIETPCIPYSINWGDGVTENFTPPPATCTNIMGPHNRSHTYTKPGTYTIQLTTQIGLTRSKTVKVY